MDMFSQKEVIIDPGLQQLVQNGFTQDTRFFYNDNSKVDSRSKTENVSAYKITIRNLICSQNKHVRHL